ncbi:lantibiotic mutacin [Streptococcus mutans]|uniref:lantibiotic mutacin n=1 Tax=Streptococcus mutans TaxID=1309 RepID=UPI0038BD8E5C
MSNTQLLEVLGTETFDVQEDLFTFDTTDTIVTESNDDPDTRFKSWSLCTPGCARTGSFNSYCC